jgi:tagatose 6-phosphate kinase
VARGLRERGISVDAETTCAATRINLELIDDHGVTEVLEPGSAPSDAELARLLARFRSLFESCERGSVVAFSGSLPQGCESYLYARLIELAKPRGLRIILDTSGSWLENGIGAGPDFVKPNRHEAEALLGRPIATPEQARGAIDDLIQRGARDAVVSLGADGLVGRDGVRAFWIRPPTLRARSAVGCGDSTVAGLAVSLQRGGPYPETLAFAAACGAANCLASSPACLDPSDVSRLLERTRVQWLA